jgi:hypothetical protein
MTAEEMRAENGQRRPPNAKNPPRLTAGWVVDGLA